MSIALPKEFVESYKDKIAPFGGNGLGEIVYVRTYARETEFNRKEYWPETIERCVNGAQQIGALYDEDEQKRLFNYIFELKGCFAGRGLWQLGTDMISKYGGPSLINCFVTSIEKIEDFEFLIDSLMLGSGVGYSIERSRIHTFPRVKSGVVVKHELTKDADIIVPDSRQGWSRLLHAVLKSYFFTGRSFSYSTILVRGKGEKLQGFGGTASGPGILIDGISAICKLLDARVGKKIRSIDALDICTIIGMIVVAGSARRSAQLAAGDPDDFPFIRAKNWGRGDIPSWRANSNNSVLADSYEEIIDELWKGYDGSGEPYGLLNRKLARKYGRLGEKVNDSEVIGTNPCMRGDQLFLTKLGWRRFDHMVGQSLSIIQDARVFGYLDNQRQEHWTIANDVSGTVTNVAGDVFLTGRDRVTMKLTTSCGRTAIATPDHHFATIHGMRRLDELLIGDELLVSVPAVEVIDFCSDEWNLGYVLGLWASDGCSTNDTVNIDLWFKSENESQVETKNIQNKIHRAIDYLVSCENSEYLLVSNGSRPIGTRPVIINQTGSAGSIKRRIQSTVIGRYIEKNNLSKKNLAWLHLQSKDQKSGFISGFFYGDGTVAQANRVRYSVRISQSSRERLSDIMLVIQELGVYSRLLARKKAGRTLLPDGRGGVREYVTKAVYEIIVSSRLMIERFAEVFRPGFSKQQQINGLLKKYKKLPYEKPMLTRVSSVEKIDGKFDVYCLSENQRRTMTVGGLCVRRCSEIWLEDGECCNLAEIFLPRIDSKEELFDLTRLLYKSQKAITSLYFPYEKTREVVARNRRLGLGVTGWLQATEQQRSWLPGCYSMLREFDRVWSKKLGVPESIKLTTVKPSGTLSLLPFVTPGIHAAYSKFFIRRVRIGTNDPIVAYCRKRGYNVQFDIKLDGSLNHDLCVVDFPCSVPEGTVTADSLSAIDQLEWVVRAQRDWSDNAVSVTCYFEKEELPDIKQWLSKNYDDNIKSVSFLLRQHHGFKLAPIEPIEESEYKRLSSKIKYIPLEDIGNDDLGLECDGGACPLK